VPTKYRNNPARGDTPCRPATTSSSPAAARLPASRPCGWSAISAVSVLIIERGPRQHRQTDGLSRRLHEISRARRLPRNASHGRRSPNSAVAARLFRSPRRWAAAARSTPWSICAAKSEDYDGWAAQLGNNGAEWSYDRPAAPFQRHRGQYPLQRRLSRHMPAICASPSHARPATRPRISCSPPRAWAIPTTRISTASGKTASASCSTPMGSGTAQTERSDAKKAFLDPLPR
jgi:hypothetical protein